MNKRNFFVASLLGLSFCIEASLAFAEPQPLVLPEQGLVLSGQEKIQYMTDKLNSFFHPQKQSDQRGFETPAGWTHEVFNVGCTPVPVGHFSALQKKGDRIIFQLHGGGYVKGMSDNHRLLGLKYATAANASDVFYVDYRIAPKYVYPAALEDAVAAYKELLKRGINPKNIILTGDSAGGNLTMELALYLKEHKLPQPGIIVLASPWADMEHKKDSSRTFNWEKDLILGNGTAMSKELINPSYAGDLKKDDPRLSPIHADLKGLPPILIQAGGHEVLLTECQQLAQKAAADAVPVTLTVYPEMSHDFSLAFPELQETIDSFKEIGDFANRYMK